MTTGRAFTVGVVLLVGLIVVLFWIGTDAQRLDTESRDIATAPHPTRRSFQPRAEEDAAETPSAARYRSVAQGHSAIAAEFGYVAVRCFVGTEFDGDEYPGLYAPRVTNGWYSDVVRERKGSMTMQVFDADLQTYRDGPHLAWDAPPGVDQTPCRVTAPPAPQRVWVSIDAPGLDSFTVFGCGYQGRQGLDIDLDAHALPCELMVFGPCGEERCGGFALVREGVSTVHVSVQPDEGEPPPAYFDNEEHHLIAELEAFESLLSDAEGAAGEVLSDLVSRRATLVESVRRRADHVEDTASD